ncbi:MAG: acetylglutamate kinase [Proteobacteria bacterium]|nr:acetylglutamate kinase [Pseudomonadota bacterium]
MSTELGLLEAIPYLRAYSGQTFVVKVGGELLDVPRSLESIATEVAALHRLGIRVVLVHGGGPQLDAAAAELGVETERVAGRRVTSPELIDAAVMVWRGRLNTLLVTALLKQGESAVGLSGADGRLVAAVRRPPAVITDDDGKRVQVDYGQVGDVSAVNPGSLEALLGAGAIPVVSPLAVGSDASLLNVNADTVATELAVALGAAKLILVTRAPGILSDPEDLSSVVAFTDLGGLDALEAKGVLTGGMRPKVAAIRRALSGGVPRVHVLDGRVPQAILREVFTTDGAGTLIVRDGDAADAEAVLG